MALGSALIAVKGWAAPEVERAYARARALCKRLGDRPELFPALFGLFYVYLLRAELRTARELAKQLLRRAQGAHDPELLMQAHLALGLALFSMAEFVLAREHLEMAVSIYDRERHRPFTRYRGVDNGYLPCRSQAGPCGCSATRTRH